MLSKQELVQLLIREKAISSDLDRADRIVCMSEILKEACTTAGVRESKIAVLGNRVSTRRFYPLPQPNYEPDTIRALFVGRLEELKNIHGIAKALAILRERKWRVHLDVSGGHAINEYLRYATSFLNQSEWRYLGAVLNRHLPEVYRDADMYVGPSYYEGFQIPIIEALACGRPCVASNQQPATEIVSEELGALVDPFDASSIAEGILSVKMRLNDPAKSERLRNACRNEAVRKWDYFAISSKEVNIYRQALKMETQKSR